MAAHLAVPRQSLAKHSGCCLRKPCTVHLTAYADSVVTLHTVLGWHEELLLRVCAHPRRCRWDLACRLSKRYGLVGVPGVVPSMQVGGARHLVHLVICHRAASERRPVTHVR
jgi:hypothetical protein